MATKKAKAKPEKPTLYFVGWYDGQDPYKICDSLAEAKSLITDLINDDDIEVEDIECYKLGKEMKITQSEITLK